VTTGRAWPTEIRRWIADSTIAGPIITLIVVFILFSLFIPNFFSLRSISSIVGAATLAGVLTIGVTMLMISGEFDLSVASLVAMGGFMYGYGAEEGGSVVLGLFLALLIPSLLGALNGLILIFTGIPSFIITLGTRSIFRGLVWIISGGTMLQLINELPIYAIFNGRFDFLNDPLRAMSGQPANFRTSFLWFLGLVVIMQYVLTRSRFGNHVFAVGGNPGAAAAQGVNVKRTKVFSFMITGLFAGFTGVLLFSQFKTIRVASGAGMELTAIAAAVVGGTFLMGGSGSIWGALIGILLIGVLRTGVILMDIPFVPADNFPAVVGATIVAAVILNYWFRSRA
jgi:simple sugar transport system permease protein